MSTDIPSSSSAHSPSSVASAEATAKAILAAEAFLIRPEDPFRLTSGLLAPFYINCRQILSHPAARATIADALAEQVRPLGVDMVAGGVTAGVPYATMVADRLGLPLVYVRPEPKDHGTGGKIEGGDVDGCRVVLIEDLITTATSIMKFTPALRAAGATVEHVAVVFSRMTDAAVPALEGAGLSLSALCDLDRLLAIALETGVASDAQLTSVRAFLDDPQGWSAERTG